MENISHSLCTVEFKQARESYYWYVSLQLGYIAHLVLFPDYTPVPD